MSGEYDGTKKYQVVFVDEYDNWFLIGFFNDLDEALPGVNGHLALYEADPDEGDKPQKVWLGEGSPFGELAERPGSFSSVFDVNVDVPEGCVQVRGFVLR